jgi:hypothetical protein|tara:strand:+ start:5072 stop:6058 length:987 start_codon:yes stop_codon:yes gene_type:complete
MPEFGEHKQRLLDAGGQDAGGQAERIITAGLNRVYRRILHTKGQEHAKREFSFTTEAETGQYGLPLYVRSDLNFDDGTNDRSLGKMTSDDYDKRYPGTTETGSPTHYYPLGNFGVQKQPSAAGAISIVSDDAGDISSRYVTVVGFDSSSNLIREKLTLNGTTKVTGTKTFGTSLENVTKTTDSGVTIDGNITVTDAASNTLAVIPVWVKSPRYSWVEFFPQPDAALTYTIRAMAYKPDLVNDEDWPDFDENFHDLLDLLAGEQILPFFGKRDTASMYGILGRQRMKEFRGQVDRDHNTVLQFADVQMGTFMPVEPWIPGVHYGLATGQ